MAVVTVQTVAGWNTYMVVLSPDETEVWNGSAFVTYSASAANAGAVAGTESPSGTYTFTIPAGITTAGDYPFVIYRRLGGSPAVTTDTRITPESSANTFPVSGSPSSPSWTSVAVLKGRLGITVTTWDTYLSAILAGVQSTISNIIGSPVLQDNPARTEYYDGCLGQNLKLRFRPVVTDSLQVWVDNDGGYAQGTGSPFGDDTELTIGEDFALADVRNGYSLSGNLTKIIGGWPVWWFREWDRLASSLKGSLGSVKVTYKAGWALADIPPGIIQAAYLEAQTLFVQGVMRSGVITPGGVLTSESLNGYSYSVGALTGFDVSGYGASRLTNPAAMAMLGGLGLIDPVIA